MKPIEQRLRELADKWRKEPPHQDTMPLSKEGGKSHAQCSEELDALLAQPPADTPKCKKCGDSGFAGSANDDIPCNCLATEPPIESPICEQCDDKITGNTNGICITCWNALCHKSADAVAAERERILNLFSDAIWEEIAEKLCDVRAAILATPASETQQDKGGNL
jgi:hypothetical protein